jgi:predicted ribosomally synthesized peptide with nif11-like leader
MSVEDFKKFGQMIAENPEVRAKAKEIGIDNVDGQIQYAKTLGLEFSKQDLAGVVKESGVSSQELSDEQLETVAGGAISTTAAAVVGAVVGIVSTGVAVASIGAQVGTTASRDW